TESAKALGCGKLRQCSLRIHRRAGFRAGTWGCASPSAGTSTPATSSTTASATWGGTRSNAYATTCAHIDAVHRAILRFRIDDVGIAGIGRCIESIAAAGAEPI